MSTDLIVDANSIYARSWYGCNQQAYGTVIGTLQMAIMCFNPNRVGEKIDRAVFCWDAGQKKAKEREERPPAYEDTKEHVKVCLEGIWGVKNVRVVPHEADDLIATIASHSEADHVIIATGDKDLCQLSSEKVSIFDVSNKGMIGRREILSRWHIKRPVQLAIALAIEGDKTDNIQGIKGWGPKKVEKLFEAVTPDMNFDETLDTVVAQIPEDKLGEFYESLDLTLLNCDIRDLPHPSPVDWCKPEMLKAQGLDELVGHYTQVYGEYHDIRVPRRNREDE